MIGEKEHFGETKGNSQGLERIIDLGWVGFDQFDEAQPGLELKPILVYNTEPNP